MELNRILITSLLIFLVSYNLRCQEKDSSVQVRFDNAEFKRDTFNQIVVNNSTSMMIYATMSVEFKSGETWLEYLDDILKTDISKTTQVFQIKPNSDFKFSWNPSKVKTPDDEIPRGNSRVCVTVWSH